MSYQQQQHQQQDNPNDEQQTPWHISEANSNCLHFFGKLKVQREQCIFTDLILIVQSREFFAHRCVLAACSPWFDARLKVHKNTRECLKIDQCKDYKIFYALLEYCYTGFIALDKHNVSELLNLSVFFQMDKLKSYCCEYLDQSLGYMNLHTAVELAFRHSLSNLIQRSFTDLQLNFEYFYANGQDALMQYSPTLVQAFLQEKGWSLPGELVLKFSSSWVNYDLISREDYFLSLLYCINWHNVDATFIASHLDEDQLYHNSQEAVYSLLSMAEHNEIYLGQCFQDLYQSLQDCILPEQELDELNDSNTFLSMAINYAVKDLEHSEGPVEEEKVNHESRVKDLEHSEVYADFYIHKKVRSPVLSVQDPSGHSGGMMWVLPSLPPTLPTTLVKSTPTSLSLQTGMSNITADEKVDGESRVDDKEEAIYDMVDEADETQCVVQACRNDRMSIMNKYVVNMNHIVDHSNGILIYKGHIKGEANKKVFVRISTKEGSSASQFNEMHKFQTQQMLRYEENEGCLKVLDVFKTCTHGYIIVAKGRKTKNGYTDENKAQVEEKKIAGDCSNEGEATDDIIDEADETLDEVSNENLDEAGNEILDEADETLDETLEEEATNETLDESANETLDEAEETLNEDELIHGEDILYEELDEFEETLDEADEVILDEASNEKLLVEAVYETLDEAANETLDEAANETLEKLVVGSVAIVHYIFDTLAGYLVIGRYGDL